MEEAAVQPAVKVTVLDAVQAVPSDQGSLQGVNSVRATFRFKCGLQSNRVWIQGLVSKVYGGGNYILVSELGSSHSSIKVRVAAAGITKPEVGQYLRVIGRLHVAAKSLEPTSGAASPVVPHDAVGAGAVPSSSVSVGSEVTPLRGHGNDNENISATAPQCAQTSKRIPLILAHKCNVLTDPAARAKLWQRELDLLKKDVVHPVLTASKLQFQLSKRRSKVTTDQSSGTTCWGGATRDIVQYPQGSNCTGGALLQPKTHAETVQCRSAHVAVKSEWPDDDDAFPSVLLPSGPQQQQTRA